MKGPRRAQTPMHGSPHAEMSPCRSPTHDVTPQPQGGEQGRVQWGPQGC